MQRTVETNDQFSAPQQSLIKLENVSFNLCCSFLTSTASIYSPASQMYWEIKYFLRMDRKCFSIFTGTFHSIVAEDTYITGQKNTKIIQRSGIIPITHQNRFFRKQQGRVAGKWSDRGSNGPSQDTRASQLYMTKKGWCLRHGLYT